MVGTFLGSYAEISTICLPTFDLLSILLAILYIQMTRGGDLNKNLHVCYFGTYSPKYPRNRIIIDGLRANDCRVTECNIPLWGSTEERISLASGGWIRLRFLWSLFFTYVKLVYKERRITDYDVMLVGYPGQIDILLARILTWFRGKKLAFDILMSLYLIMEERGLDHVNVLSRLLMRLVREIEYLAYKLPDVLIIDTFPHRDYLSRHYHIDSAKFALIPLGADERYFDKLNDSSMDSTFRVVYHGKFVPLHGVEYIVEAAKVLESYDICFQFIGEGTTKSQAEALVKKHHLQNVIFSGWVNRDDLKRYLADADVCLGVFGSTPQARYTVPNKIWEGIASKRPVITGDTPAVRSIFDHGRHLWLCVPASPHSLAEAVLVLFHDANLRKRLACQGYRYWQRNFTTVKTGQRVCSCLSAMDITPKSCTSR
jgi:glycosyltransferase involved in cell wall biosynthesis